MASSGWPSPHGLNHERLATSTGIEAEIVNSAEELELLDGLNLAVATRAHLIALKVFARDDRNRLQDWDDLRALAFAVPEP